MFGVLGKNKVLFWRSPCFTNSYYVPLLEEVHKKGFITLRNCKLEPDLFLSKNNVNYLADDIISNIYVLDLT